MSFGRKDDECANKCEITYASVEGLDGEPSWGYMCGREPGEKKKTINEYRLFTTREKMLKSIGKVKLPEGAPKVAIPRSLSMYTFLPLWRRFFGELGYKIVMSPTTNNENKRPV